MIKFINTRVKDGYIYATAEDTDCGVTREIKVSTDGKDFSVDGVINNCFYIINALWVLQERLKVAGELDYEERVS